MITFCYVFAALLGTLGNALLAIPKVRAEATDPVRTDAAQGPKASEILRSRPFYLNAYGRRTDARPFCNAFIRDLKVSRNLAYVEPVVQTSDPNHSELVKYQKQCKSEKNRPQGFGQSSYVDLKTIGDRNFKLYRLPINGAGRDGREVIYADIDPASNIRQSTGGYYVVDFGTCDIVGGLGVEPARGSIYTALVSYSDGYYVYKLQNLAREYADQWTLDVARTSTWKDGCHWTTVPPRAPTKQIN
jgi:hypothetical protein